MSGPALVILTDRRAFEGEATLTETSVTLHGRERQRVGPDNSQIVCGERHGTYSWPAKQVREVRWA